MALGLDFDGMLWDLAYRYSRTQLRDHYTVEDLFSEARLVALTVIKKYKIEKNVKLSSYVYRCVENRLRDLGRSDKRSVVDYHANPLEFDRGTISTCEDLEFALMMKGILTDREYVLFQKLYLEDFSMKEILEQKIMRRREAERCLLLIHRKYQSLAKSHQKILNQKARQDRWLSESQS